VSSWLSMSLLRDTVAQAHQHGTTRLLAPAIKLYNALACSAADGCGAGRRLEAHLLCNCEAVAAAAGVLKAACP